MRLYEYVDEFIADSCPSLGAEYRRADVQTWADGCGYEINVASALDMHRKSPARRVFTTERVGMGPNSFYRVVEIADGVDRVAAKRIQRQFGEEMVERWRKEYGNRMYPVALRDRRSTRYLKEAAQTMALVANVLGTKLSVLEDEDVAA